MCELLIRVKDKPKTGIREMDSHRSRRGDVIAAIPDGGYWGRAERENPEWLIVRVPGMTVDEGWGLTVPEPIGQSFKTRGRPRRTFWKRMFTLDLTLLPTVNAASGLTREKESVTVPAEKVRAARKTRTPILQNKVNAELGS